MITGCHRDTDLPVRLGRRWFPALGLALAAVGLLHLLYSLYAAFSWRKFALVDYGLYTNMLWNCGHGAPFRMLVDQTYLRTHLSFTLALLGPLFRAWDHPFLPALIQWACFAGGAALVARAARAPGAPAAAAAALLVFWVWYPLSQGAVLCSFHGVALYFVLAPWLHLSLARRPPGAAWLPLALLLGVREDAFLVAAPLLLYAAVRDRSRRCALLAAAAVAYGLAASLWLYPWINGESLFDRRSGYIPGLRKLQSDFAGAGLRGRLEAVAAVLAPAVPLLFARGARRPFAMLVLVPLAVALLGRSRYQYMLRVQYATPVVVGLALAAAEYVSGRCRGGQPPSPRAARAAAAWLAAAALAGHLYAGFLAGGGNSELAYRRVNPSGAAAVRAARAAGREGVLVCDDRLAPFAANRAGLLTWDRRPSGQPRPDYILLRAPELLGDDRRGPRRLLRKGGYGLAYSDGVHLLLGRGHPEGRNGELREIADRLASTLRAAAMSKPAGEDVLWRDARKVRYWNGDARRAPAAIAAGSGIKLPAGSYRAVFTVAAGPIPARRAGGHGRGLLSVHALGRPENLAMAAVDAPAGARDFAAQALEFRLAERARVEPRVTGGDAELWVDEVVFERADGDTWVPAVQASTDYLPGPR